MGLRKLSYFKNEENLTFRKIIKKIMKSTEITQNYSDET